VISCSGAFEEHLWPQRSPQTYGIALIRCPLLAPFSLPQDDVSPAAPVSQADAECYAEWGVTLAQEEVLIQQLRDEILLDVELGSEWDDVALQRYLRARKHDVAKAKAMVLSTLAWRAQVGADTILDEFDFHEKQKFHEHYPEGFYNTDREGRPVYVQQPGNIDTAALWTFTTMDRSVKYHITQQEKYVRRIAPAASVAAGRPRYQSVVLIDMEGVGVGTITGEVRTIMGKVMSIDQVCRRQQHKVFRYALLVLHSAAHACVRTQQTAVLANQERPPCNACIIISSSSSIVTCMLRFWKNCFYPSPADCRFRAFLNAHICRSCFWWSLQDYYPELMHKSLIINAPTSFRIIWSMIKYLLDGRTQGKIHVLPVDYKEELFKEIAPENLLPKYGGTCKSALIDEPGPWQDEEIMAEVKRREEERAAAYAAAKAGETLQAKSTGPQTAQQE
jgi:hypothetical protein